MKEKESDRQQLWLGNQIREAERECQLSLNNKHFTHLLSLTERLEQLLKRYYCATGRVQPHHERQYRMNAIVLMHNKAAIYFRLKSPEMASEVLLSALQHAKELMEEEQMKLGFMDQEQALLEGNQALQNISQLKLELARLYLCLSRVAAQGETIELSLASALKCLELVKELYERWGFGPEIEELLALCDIREKLSHRKKLEEVGVSALMDGINWLLESPSTWQGQAETGGVVALGELETLVLGQPKRTGLLALKQLHCWSLQLLGTLEEGEEQGQDSNTKNTLLNCLLCIYLCKTHLPPSPELNNILDQYIIQFQTKTPLLRPLSLDNLLDRLSLGPADLKADESTASFSHLPSFQEGNTGKGKRTVRKAKGSLSKQKGREKSREKLKTVGAQSGRKVRKIPNLIKVQGKKVPGKGRLTNKSREKEKKGFSEKKPKK